MLIWQHFAKSVPNIGGGGETIFPPPSPNIGGAPGSYAPGYAHAVTIVTPILPIPQMFIKFRVSTECPRRAHGVSTESSGALAGHSVLDCI